MKITSRFVTVRCRSNCQTLPKYLEMLLRFLYTFASLRWIFDLFTASERTVLIASGRCGEPKRRRVVVQ